MKRTRRNKVASRRRRLKCRTNPPYAAMQRLRATKRGRAALSRFKRFWGVKTPPEVKTLVIPGPARRVVPMVGLGVSPAVNVANGPKGRATQTRRIKRRGMLVAHGKRMMILYGRKSHATKPKLTFMGWCPATEYIPPRSIERAGSFKSGKHWVHKHDDKGGKWPKLYRDQAGNVHYRGGTYRVTDWLHR